jgi:hypothetical protein
MDAVALAQQIATAVEQFDWLREQALAARLVAEIQHRGTPVPAGEASAILYPLRRARTFPTVARVSEALIQQGDPAGIVIRSYAQALIEQGRLAAAEALLNQRLLTKRDGDEVTELKGLLGRVRKQWYVNTRRTDRARDQQLLADAISAYLEPYTADPRRNYWHGINVVALLERARRDGFAVHATLDPAEIARTVLAAVQISSAEARWPWDLATAMEAHLALGNLEAAVDAATDYAAHPLLSAFEVASTRRQLVEVWNLTEDSGPGALLLPLLRGALLRSHGGSLRLTREQVLAEEARLQRIHGHDRPRPRAWMEDALKCCDSIARIETMGHVGVGTGWLIRRQDCYSDGSDECLLVTNAHVISPESARYPRALLPDQAAVHFEKSGITTSIQDVVWHSAVSDLDCTILRLTSCPPAPGLPIQKRRVRRTVPAPRMYIIGYPNGRGLEYSLDDNFLIDLGDKYLHYRTPTEAGSSGSPVFDENWMVVGIHRAGEDNSVKTTQDAEATDANEGIALAAVLELLAQRG